MIGMYENVDGFFCFLFWSLVEGRWLKCYMVAVGWEK
jgi:hypothetical protein